MDKPMIVGDPDGCPINPIALIISEDVLFLKDWSKLATGLDLRSAKIETLRQDKLLNKISISDVIVDVLETWVSKLGSKAMLETLLEVIEGTCGGTAVGENLRLEFNLPCRFPDLTSLAWNDLSPDFKVRVIENALKFYPYAEIREHLPESKGTALVNLMTGKLPRLFKDTLPPQLSYYVNRTVITRNIISAKIFEQDLPDIFLITGMDQYELSELAQNKLTSTSNEQIGGTISAKFIILDQQRHFERICGKTSQPVHYLHKGDDGKLRWIRSKRGIGTLHKFLDMDQDEVVEELLCKYLESRGMPVCISDSPGMGKSALLAQVGRHLEKMYPDRAVFFIVLSEFIKQIKQMDANGMDRKAAIEKIIEDTTCGNKFDEIVLKGKLESGKKIEMELLLDGFDEIDSNDVELAHEILDIINTSYLGLRLWVTSRPHFLEDLEKTLNVLGFKIKPFSEDDQVRFLTSFWTREENNADPEKLRDFAKECLEDLKCSINNADQDLAGIPLQCLLIGEVFEDEAAEFAHPNSRTAFAPLVEINSITSLYQLLIKKKLEKYKSVFKDSEFDQATIMEMHVRLSLTLIFSEQFIDLDQDQLKEVLKIGILEASTTVEAPRFIHRTFAEYFIAWFVVKKLESEAVDPAFPQNYVNSFRWSLMVKIGKEWGWTTELNDFFFERIMECNRTGDSCKFVHTVTSHFLNSLFEEMKPIPANNAHIMQQIFNSEETMVRLAHASTTADLFQIFNLFNGMNAFDNQSKIIFDHEVLLLSLKKASLDLVKSIFIHFEKHHEFDLATKTEALRVVVRRGTFSILEFLIKEKQVREILTEFTEGTRKLLFDCIGDSKDNSGQVVKQKMQVVRMLVRIKREILEERDDAGNTPLLAYHVNVLLLIELIKMGANTLARDKKNNSIIDVPPSRDHLSGEEYHLLVTAIPEVNLGMLVQSGRIGGADPLGKILENIDPIPDTFDTLRKVKANFKFLDEEHNSIVTVAIKYGRSAGTFRKLIDCGAEVTWKGKKKESLLHIAADKGNVDIVKTLIEGRWLDVNGLDEDGLTPLDYLIKSNTKSGNRLETGKTLHGRGGTFKETVNSEDQTWLHVVVEQGNAQSVKLLLHLGSEPNVLDVNGNTPLHQLAKQAKPFQHSIANILLDYNADPNKKNKRGETPFQLTLKNTESLDLEFVQLLEAKTDIQWSPEIATVTLRIVIQNGKYIDDDKFVSIVREYERLGANFDSQDEDGDYLLHIAAFHGHLRAVRFLVMDMGANIDATNHQNETILYKAASFTKDGGCRLEIIQYLISQGANVLAEDNENVTFFERFLETRPSASGLDSLMQYIGEIEYPVFPFHELFQKPRRRNMTTLVFAIVFWVEPMKSTLKMLNAHIHAVDVAGRSILCFAIWGGRSPKFISLLINQFHVNWKVLTKRKETMLHLSAERGTEEHLKLFIDIGGIDVNGVDEDGETALHKAIWHGDAINTLAKCSLLIQSQADVNILNNEGYSPFALAIMKNKVDVQKYLEGITSKNFDEPTEGIVSRHVDNTIASSSRMQTQPNNVAEVNQIKLNVNTIKCMLLQANDLASIDGDVKESIYFFVVQYPRPSGLDFHSLIEYLVEKDLVTLLTTIGEGRDATPLHLAIRNLDIDYKTLSLLRTCGVDFNVPDKHGNSLLAHALFGNRTREFLSTLVVKLGVETKHQNHLNQNMLHIAANMCTPDCLMFLLDLGTIDVNAKDSNGLSALHHCAISKNGQADAVEKCKLLVTNGADVNLTSHDNETPLHIAAKSCCEEGSLKIIKFLIENGSNAFLRNCRGNTFLHTYIGNLTTSNSFQFHEIVEYMIEKKGARIFDPLEHDELPLLHNMVSKVDVQIMRTLSLLHSNSVNFNSVDTRGWSVLEYAIIGRRGKEMISTLINTFGLNWKHLNNEQSNMLHVAASAGSAIILSFFLDLGELDINGKRSDGNTPLLSALTGSNIDVLDKCKLLISKGADVNSANYEQQTALHVAAGIPNKVLSLEVIQYLVLNGADVFATDKLSNIFLPNFYFSNCTQSAFHLLITFLSTTNISISNLFSTQFNLPGAEYTIGNRTEQTILHNLVVYFEPHDDTLSLLNSCNVNFNAVDALGHSLLYYAVSGQRSENFVRSLVSQYRVDPRQQDENNNSMLHVSAYAARASVLQFFIDLGMLDVNGRNSDGNTPLHMALANKKELDVMEKCKLLVDKGADVNSRNSTMDCPLHFATRGFNNFFTLELVKYLGANGADMSAKNEDGLTVIHTYILKAKNITPASFHSLADYFIVKNCSPLFDFPGTKSQITPLHLAVYKLELELKTMSLLHSSIANFNAASKGGNTVLSYSIYGNRSKEFISALITKFGADPKHLNGKGESMLHLATISGTSDILAFLLDLGVVDVNTKDSGGKTPFLSTMCPSPNKHNLPFDIIAKCEILLIKGADANDLDNEQNTALHWIAYISNKPVMLDVIKYCIDKGTDVYKKNGEGFTFLHYLVTNSCTPSLFHSMVEYLVSKNLSSLFDITDPETGETILQTTVLHLEPEEKSLELLHLHGVNFNATDNQGRSLLMNAIRGKRSTKFMSVLISTFHADVNQWNVNGNTPIHFVVSHPDLPAREIISKCQLLIDNGADVNVADLDQRTTIHHAAFVNDKKVALELIKYLIENGAVATASDEDGITFLHIYTSSSKVPTPAVYHSMLEYLACNNLLNIINSADGERAITPLHFAIQNIELQDSTLSLLKSSANINFNALDKSGASPLTYAIWGKQSKEFLHKLIECGADYLLLTNHNNSVLHTAAQNGTLEALGFFLGLDGLDINLADGDGDTPLHCAVQQEDKSSMLEKCMLLIAHGADINYLNNEGQTPLAIVSDTYDGSRKEELVELLMPVKRIRRA